jgi:hypothetical protein
MKKICHVLILNATDYGAFSICALNSNLMKCFLGEYICSCSRLVIFSRLWERINVITRLLANRFTDRAFFVTIDYPVRRVCYGGGTRLRFLCYLTTKSTENSPDFFPHDVRFCDFQGRHKRNATFPGGQTTILQVTPTIRSKCSCYANFTVIHAYVRIFPRR